MTIQPCLRFMHTLWDDYSEFLIQTIRKLKTERNFLKSPITVSPGEEDKIAGEFKTWHGTKTIICLRNFFGT